MAFRGGNNLSISSFKNFLFGLGIFLVLVFVLEVIVSRIPDEIVADVAEQCGMRYKNEKSLNPGELDALILGDCFFFAGVNPQQLDNQLNIRSLNLAMNRVQTYMASYVLFKNVVQHAPHPPRLVILGVHASSLFFPLDMNMDVLRQTIIPTFRISGNLLNELTFKMKVQVLWHYGLTRVPTLNKQYLLRGNWPYLISHFDQSRYLHFEKNIAENKGFFNEDLMGHRQKFRINFKLPAVDTPIREYNDRYIKKILELASTHGIKVVLVTNSYRKDFTEHINYNIMFDVEYFEKLRSIYPAVIGVLNMHDVVLDPDRYVDITHLDGQGAALFTDELARRIKPLIW
jgi:hypothetical protein